MSDRPQVLRIVSRLNIGGVSQHVILLTAATQDRYPTLVVTGTPGLNEGDLSQNAIARGISVHHLPELGRRISPIDDVRALWKLWKLCRTHRPRIVHTHTAKAGALGRVAAWLAGVPVRVHTFHGHVLKGYFGPVLNMGFRLAERMLAAITTQVIVISPLQAAELSHYIGVPTSRLAIIPLGLALERFRVADAASCRERFRRGLGLNGELLITLVGRLAPIKNHPLALRAFARFSTGHPEARLVIVGDGEEGPRLKQLARELGVFERVFFTGWSQDLEAVYYGSDIVALTSDNEGTPVCVIEALACGRPVVTTEVGGVPDVLEGGNLGLMVRPGDEEALVQALNRLADPTERQRWSDRGRERILAKYSVERLANDIGALYAELASADDTRQRG